VVSGDDCVDDAIGSCASPNYVGDGFCDDGNNNAGCSWDDGDCCGSSGKNKQFSYCTDCECLDCAYSGCDGSDDCLSCYTGACGVPSYTGDGFCDDDNNNAACAWDEGDCCGSSGKNAQHNYCTDCACLDCTYSDCSGGGACGASSFVGDGFCDDDNNNCGCGWDQGDCCGDTGKPKQLNYCSDCECLDPDEQ